MNRADYDKKRKKVTIRWGRLLLTLLLLGGLCYGGWAALHKLQTNRAEARLQMEEQEKREAAEAAARLAAEQARQAEEAARREAEEQKAKQAALRLAAMQDGYLLLLNKEHAVEKEYVPSDMVKIEHADPGKPEETHYLRAEAAAAFEEMMEAAQADGYEIKMTTGYRSYGYQSALYTNYVNRYGQAEADTFSARPGTSEHQSGLASDISCGSLNWGLYDAFGDTPEGQWIQTHAADYGFIVRYPRDAADGRTSLERTGYVYEPWHVRYVTPLCAQEIAAGGYVLEEYLQQFDWATGYPLAE